MLSWISLVSLILLIYSSYTRKGINLHRSNNWLYFFSLFNHISLSSYTVHIYLFYLYHCNSYRSKLVIHLSLTCYGSTITLVVVFNTLSNGTISNSCISSIKYSIRPCQYHAYYLFPSCLPFTQSCYW